MNDSAMTTTYGILVFQTDRDQDLNRLRRAIAAELESLGLHRSVAVAVAETRPPDDGPCVGVYLGSVAAATDEALRTRITEALREGIVLVPVVGDLGSFSTEVPDSLAFANGIAWGSDVDLRRLVHVLLQELGIEEKHRRVFISHKREDGLGAAEQLHDQLTHAGYRPFIDRFAIRAGRDVQNEIANALEDHAFLLLLETPAANTSDWVFDEVDYALSHTMGILIVSWPGEPVPVPGSHGLPRLELSADDLVTDAHGFDTLTEPALDRVIAEVEASHARGLSRRRRMLLGSIEEAARAAGADCVPLRGWRLLVSQRHKSTMVATTPRLPTARDLQVLDEAVRAEPGDLAPLLVHSARVLDPRLKEHLGWVAGDRNLTVMPENAIGAWW